MTFLLLTLLVLCQLLIGLFKGVSDITDHKDNWHNSIFSRFDIESFFGSKDMTWKRKYNFPKLIRNHMVMFSDVWHLSNTLRFASWIAYSVCCYFVGLNECFSFYWIVPISIINRFSFHLFYMYLLRNGK